MATAATEVTTDAPKAKLERTPEHKLRMKVGRTIGRGIWQAGYKVEFPKATKEETKAAWEEARKDFTKIGLKALKTLEKSNYVVTVKADA